MTGIYSYTLKWQGSIAKFTHGEEIELHYHMARICNCTLTWPGSTATLSNGEDL